MRTNAIPVCLAAAAVLVVGPALAQDHGWGDAGKGLAYARANCTECHEVRRGHFDSPEPDVPAFQDIADAEDMSEIALYPFFQTAHRTMPNLVIPPDDVADLTAYLLSMRKRP